MTALADFAKTCAAEAQAARRDFEELRGLGSPRGSPQGGGPSRDRADHLESEEEDPPLYASDDELFLPPPYRRRQRGEPDDDREFGELMAELGLADPPSAAPEIAPQQRERSLVLRLAAAAGEGHHPRELTVRVREAFAGSEHELEAELRALEVRGPTAAPRLLGAIAEQKCDLARSVSEEALETRKDLLSAFRDAPGGPPWVEVFGDVEPQDLLSSESLRLLDHLGDLAGESTGTTKCRVARELAEAARSGRRGPHLRIVQSALERRLSEAEDSSDDSGSDAESDSDSETESALGAELPMAADAWRVAVGALSEPWAPPLLSEKLGAARAQFADLFDGSATVPLWGSLAEAGADFEELPGFGAPAGIETAAPTHELTTERVREFFDRVDAIATECEDAEAESSSATELLSRKRKRLEEMDPSPCPLKKQIPCDEPFCHCPYDNALGPVARVAAAEANVSARGLNKECELPCVPDAPAEELYGRAEALQRVCEVLADKTCGSAEGRRLAREWQQLDEIYAEQARAGFIVDGAPFADLCDEILQEFRDPPRFSPGAYEALQAATEGFVVERFEEANGSALRAGRTHVRPEDIRSRNR